MSRKNSHDVVQWIESLLGLINVKERNCFTFKGGQTIRTNHHRLGFDCMINVLMNNAIANIVPMSEHSPSLNNDSDSRSFAYLNLNIVNEPNTKTEKKEIAITTFIS